MAKPGRGSRPSGDLAGRVRRGDPEALATIAARPIAVRPDNLVERPWGGRRLAGPDGGEVGLDARYGERFELAADPDDPEAAAHPSAAVLPDGSELPLPELLALGAAELLGARHVERHGPRVPLLPKTLDVAELLSVQAHPPGQPEVYVVLDCDPGASVRVGFRRPIDPAALRERLLAAQAAQHGLIERIGAAVDHDALQRVLAPLLLDRDTPAARLREALAPFLTADADTELLLGRLRAACTEMLDALNPIEVAPGTVIYNADPASRAAGRPSAAVHALGNPEGRSLLLLEVRKPGPTLRAWDHGRFPPRELAVQAALEACASTATDASDYLVTPAPVAGSPGVARSVASPEFVVEHVTPDGAAPVHRDAGGALRTVHVIRGAMSLYGRDGTRLAELAAGCSALLPVGLGPYAVHGAAGAEAVEVTLP